MTASCPTITHHGSSRVLAHFFESHIRYDPSFEILEQAGSLSVLRRK
jgi:hypothetical protein